MSYEDDRKNILAGMRETIWVESGGTQRLATRVPAATSKPATDLVSLYEHMNRDTVENLLERFSRPARRTSSSKARHFGRLLVLWAMGLNDEAPTGLQVPQFHVTYANDELQWGGQAFSNRAGIFDRNPAIPSEEEYLGETLGAPTLNPAGKSWYVFYYEGTWRKQPKQYWGPFSTRDAAITARDADAEKYDTPFTRYKVQNLSDDQFHEIWGAAPKHNPATDHYYIGHRDGAEVEIDAEHGKFDTLEEALDVAGRMDAATRHRSVIVCQGNAYEEGATWHTDVTLYSIATGELLLQENPSWNKSEVQSLLFDQNHFSEAQAKHWAKEHGFHYGDVDNTAHYHRLRQFPPAGGPCRTIEFGHQGIKAVVCSAARGKPPWISNPADKRWYVFFYEKGGLSGKPKEYFGPFDSEDDASEALEANADRYDTPRSQYKVRHLTDAQFTHQWGAKPR